MFIDKYGKQCARLPSEIIKNQIKLENENKGNFSLFVEDLKKIDINSIKPALQKSMTSRNSMGGSSSQSTTDLLKMSSEFKNQIIRDKQD